MTSRRFLSFFWILFLFVAQSTIHTIFPPVITPLLVIGVIFFALTEGPSFGAVIGCFAGFLLDMLGVGKLGGSMAMLSVTGALAGFFSGQIFYDSFFTQIALPLFSQYLICVMNLFLAKSLPHGEGASLEIIKEAFFLSQPWSTALASLAVFSFLKKVSPPRHSRHIAWDSR